MKEIVDRIPGLTLLEVIGQGAQGIVCKVCENATRRTVALKICRQGLLATRSERLRFDHEIRQHSKLNHPHIVRVRSAGKADGYGWFTTDFIKGKPLDLWHRESTSVFSSNGEWNLDVFLKICDAVRYLHACGIVHRDLKPSNILVDDHDNPHLLDFGLARTNDGSEFTTLTADGMMVGTPQYAAPEQLLGTTVDQRCDIYALGIILYDWVVQGYAYDCDPDDKVRVLQCILEEQPLQPRTRYPGIASDLETIILKCLEKKTARRYQTANELIDDLNAYQDGQTINARPPSMTYRAKLAVKRHQGWMVAAAIGFAAVISGLSLATRVRPRPAEAPKLGTSWLAGFQGSDEELLEIVENNRFQPDIVKSHALIGAQGKGALDMKIAAERLQAQALSAWRQNNLGQSLRYMSAIRRLSLDARQTWHPEFNGVAHILLKMNYDVARQILDQQPGPLPEMATWLVDEPPLPSDRALLEYLRHQLVNRLTECSVDGRINRQTCAETIPNTRLRDFDEDFSWPATETAVKCVNEIFQDWIDANTAGRTINLKDRFGDRPTYKIIAAKLPYLDPGLNFRTRLRKSRDELHHRASGGK